MLALAVAVGVAPLSRADEAAPAETLRTHIDKWIEVSRMRAVEEAEWQRERRMLERRIELLEQEEALLDERIAEARESASVAENQRAELLDERATLTQVASATREQIARYEREVNALADLLPPPLLRELEPALARMPHSPNESTQPLAQRAQNLIAVLEAVEQFNNDITLTSEIRELDGGEKVEVQTLYLGLGQAWYLDGTGQRAGILRPVDGQWQSIAAPELAPAIDQAIAIYRNQATAKLIELPVSISHVQ